MSSKVFYTQKFKREAKRLSKKFHSLKDELDELHLLLSENPNIGKSIGHNLFKVRLAIKSKGKGKSGGARVITYSVHASKAVFVLTIYDKTEIETLDVKSIKDIVSTL